MKEEKKPKLTKEDSIFLSTILLGWGFTKITRKDSGKSFARLDLSPPIGRKIDGREVGFRYSNNGYTVVVWTSYIDSEEKWRDVGTDYMWVLIRKGDIVKYFAKPFARTAGVILKVLRYAWVSQWRVNNIHICTKCLAYMDIERRKGPRGYYYVCKRTDLHDNKKYFILPWDYNLPPIAKQFVGIRREYTKKYKERNKKFKLNPKPAETIRKKWGIGNPQNLEN